jgi:hypothetical protein
MSAVSQQVIARFSNALLKRSNRGLSAWRDIPTKTVGGRGGGEGEQGACVDSSVTIGTRLRTGSLRNEARYLTEEKDVLSNVTIGHKVGGV